MKRPETLTATLAFEFPSTGLRFRKTITLLGIRVGYFVIHECLDPREFPFWQITHALSGMRVGKDYIYKDINEAVRVASALHDPVWADIRSEKSRGLEKAKSNFLRVRKEIYG